MKILLSILFVFLSFSLSAQDSTKIRSLVLKASTIESTFIYLFGQVENDSAFQVYLDVRKFWRPTRPAGTALITIDSIPTVELAKLYNYCLENHSGMRLGNLISGESSFTAARAANTYLNRLCTEYDNFWLDKRALIRSRMAFALRGR